MKSKTKWNKKSGLGWQLKKYYRWAKVYLRNVKNTERELGGELRPC